MNDLKIFVSGFGTDFTDEQLRSLFEPFGEVAFANIILDRETGKSRGFGFVFMEEMKDAERAIATLHLSTVDDFQLVVTEARRREPDRNDTRERR